MFIKSPVNTKILLHGHLYFGPARAFPQYLASVFRKQEKCHSLEEKYKNKTKIKQQLNGTARHCRFQF